MTSTLWFWITCLVILLFIIWWIRRFIWRVIIICVVLFLLVLVWRWISPNTVDSVLWWFQDLPVRATNYVNTEILNKDIVLPLHNQVTSIKDEISDSVEEGIGELTEVIDTGEIVVDKTPVKDNEEPRYSWFAKFFKDDETSVDEEVIVEEDNEEIHAKDDEGKEPKKFVENRQQESIELKFWENWEIVVETTTRSWEKIVDKVAQVGSETSNGTGKEEVKKETKKEVKENSGSKVEETKKADEEENEVVYIKSNPKKTENTTTTKTTTDATTTPVKSVRGLTAAEVREANELFN